MPFMQPSTASPPGKPIPRNTINQVTGPKTPASNPAAVTANNKKGFPKTVTEARTPLEPTKKMTMLNDKVEAAKKSASEIKAKGIQGNASSAWDSTKQLADKKITNVNKILDKGGADIIKSAKGQLLDKLDSLIVVPEPVLLLTLKGLAKMGGDPGYKNYYVLTEMIKKDYLSIVKWMVEEFKYSPASGKAATYLKKAPTLGATNTAFWVIDQLHAIKGDKWFTTNRYLEFKKVTKYGKINFTANTIMNKMREYNIETPGLGLKGGTKEFGIRHKYTTAEVNLFLPEKKKGLIWETHPLTVGHVDVFNKMLDGKTHGGTLDHAIIYKRLRQNVVVVNPIVSILTDVANDVAKELGIDKIINAINNREALMYDYIKYLKSQKLL